MDRAISEQAVLELIADYDLSMGQVVRAIHALPPANPQESVVDKIRAEIAELDLGFVDEDYKAGVAYAVMKFNKILDKYKAEGEV